MTEEIKRIRRNTDMWRKTKKGVTPISRNYTNSSKKSLWDASIWHIRYFFDWQGLERSVGKTAHREATAVDEQSPRPTTLTFTVVGWI